LKFNEIFPGPKPIIGMIALPPLLGYPQFAGMNAIVERAISDLQILQQEGVDGVCVENDYDRPHQLTVGPEIVSSFTSVAQEVALHAKVPVGLQVLLNDWRASLSIAKVIDAQFVRLDFFVDKVRIQAGVIEPQPEAVFEYRKRLAAEGIALFTDVQVKHSELLEAGKTLTTSVHQAIANHSDAIVISGRITGEAPTLEDLSKARKAAGDFPVLIGSGATPQNIRELLQYADGAIVGTAFKSGMTVEDRIVLERVKELMRGLKSANSDAG
jgi:membrane complex biogenesis BtpA family protein